MNKSLKNDPRIKKVLTKVDGFMELLTHYVHKETGKPVLVVGGFARGWEVQRKDNNSMKTVLSTHGSCKAALNSLAENEALTEVTA